MTNEKELLVLDFDHTIINENSDVFVIRLAPEGRLPPRIKELYKPDGWTLYMKTVFLYLYQNNIRPADFFGCLDKISLVTGMKELLTNLHATKRFEIIVISDSNTVFINYILKNAELDFVVDEVFTNPAYFDSEGCLHLKEYHLQDWCDKSSKNLCKGSILQSYVAKRKQEDISFSRISYVGDGQNDFCPLLCLSRNDCAFPRIGYSLWKKLKEEKIVSSVHPWETGFDILNVLCPATS
ncbi:pyridoxal phosphate phosphatase PHOSPHO2-like [Centruroides vittatus]|uniref:pyridoxal phosphate phosphatase PHOSPHO2-like n=1 Tax=Centruroides vittatus TaxID=120091 RepID=UPI00350FB9E4